MADTGFSAETIGFLIELRARNDRAWYYEHKPDYERLVFKPFQALVTALAPTMQKIDPLIETAPAIDKTISRIYRDSRFTADKSLYRDRAWLTFERKTKEKPDKPAFYFELHPSGYRYGVGFYTVSPKTMEAFRAAIDRDEAAFADEINRITATGEFELAGDEYKRNRYNGAYPEIADWYNKKNIYLAANRAHVDEAFDFDTLSARLAKGFTSLAGIYLIWRKACTM